MKRRLLLLLFAAITFPKTAVMASGYDMRYLKQHLLYQRGAETNVIDLDLEWPEYVDGSLAAPLKRELTTLLFQNESESLDEALPKFLQRFGTPVTQQFSTIPDDDKFCYIHCTLRHEGYRKGRFISFRATYQCQPGVQSSQKSDTLTTLLTYDVAEGKLLRMKDLLRMTRLEAGYYGDDVVYGLLSGAKEQLPSQMLGIQLVDACLKDTRVRVDMLCLADEGIAPFTSEVEADVLRTIMTKTARNLMEKDADGGRLADPYPSRVFWMGDSVYTKVDVYPKFEYGGKSLSDYLVANLSTPKEAKGNHIEGRVTLSFVVDTGGYVRDVRVISPLAPVLDREAARVVRMMPHWRAGAKNGRPVNVRCKLPVYFKID